MAVLALATGLYAFLVGPTLRFLLTGGASALGRVASWAPALEAAGRERLLAGAAAPAGRGGAALKGLAYAAQFTWTGQFGQRTVAWLRRALLDALLRQSPVQLAARMSGDLLSRFSADVTAVETAAIYAVGSWIRDGLQMPSSPESPWRSTGASRWWRSPSYRWPGSRGAAHPLGAPTDSRRSDEARRHGRAAARGARRGAHGAGLRGGAGRGPRASPPGRRRTRRRSPVLPGRGPPSPR